MEQLNEEISKLPLLAEKTYIKVQMDHPRVSVSVCTTYGRKFCTHKQKNVACKLEKSDRFIWFSNFKLKG